jgi:hypothetical protein
MEILSHRGYWKIDSEKNKLIAFQRSFSCGFGVETDIRDLNGVLVISHDIPKLNDTEILSVDSFFKLYKSFGKDFPLALNIKSDGLQEKLLKLIIKYEITNYFVFDMSIPDTIGYLNKGYKVFTRQSEYEQTPAFVDIVEGIWLDEFISNWVKICTIKNHIENNRKVCIVSPELHKRNYLSEWANYREMFKTISSNKIMICTDLPEKAKQFFNL